MIAFLLSPFGKVVAGIVAVSVLIGIWQLDRHYQFETGRSAERQAAVERAAELIKERANDDAELSRMDNSDLCVELGGVWVLDHCE